MQKRKVGLALGSGGARGLAHIGVLEVLEKEGIPIDMIAGTSIGALVGALYAQGKGIEELKALAMELGTRRLSFLLDPALPKSGLLRGRRVTETLKSVIGDLEFSDLGMPFACVAADIDSGEEVVIREGLVWEGVRASGSIPVLFAVAKRGGRYLVDGSLVNPVPVNVLRDMGAEYIIAVSLTPHRHIEGAKEPGIFSIMMQVLYISSYRIIRVCLNEADIVVVPQVGHIAHGDFHRVEDCVLQGVLAAQASIAEIKKHI